MIDLDAVQDQYPHPQPAGAQESGGLSWSEQYCVGGALCLYANLKFEEAKEVEHFPYDEELAWALEQLNSVLASSGISIAFAREIIGHNDASDFDAAWDAVREALTWAPSTKAGSL